MMPKNTKNFFKNTSLFIKGLGSDADKDWKVTLILFIVCILATAIFHVRIFFVLQDEIGKLEFASPSQHDVFNTTLLSDMVGKYESRAKEYNQIKATSTRLVDPSH